MSVQKSFEDRIGKYKAGDVLLQSWADYNPSTAMISKAENSAFIAAVENANSDVIAKEQTVGDKRNERAPLCFTQYSENSQEGILNPDCAEQRIIGVHSYVKSLFPGGSKTTNLLKAIVDKVRPRYKGATSMKSFTVPAGQSIVVNNVVSSSLAFNTGGTNMDWSEVNGTNPPRNREPG